MRNTYGEVKSKATEPETERSGEKQKAETTRMLYDVSLEILSTGAQQIHNKSHRVSLHYLVKYLRSKNLHD